MTNAARAAMAKPSRPSTVIVDRELFARLLHAFEAETERLRERKGVAVKAAVSHREQLIAAAKVTLKER